MMVGTVGTALLLGYLPGALVYRLPMANRDQRAALDADERIFWHVVLSVSWTLTAVLALSAVGVYTFARLLWLTAGLVAALAVVGRTRLGYGGTAAAPRWTIVLPLLLVVLAGWRFDPPSEYIIGGKDPGVMFNEGIQIAQRGTLSIHEEVVEAVPAFARDLFFPSEHVEEYYSRRFMGFFIQDPSRGAVIGQFPHLYPASIAVGYAINGLTGGRYAVTFWGVLGVLAVYFLGARLFGRGVAWSAAALLTLHIIQVWYARYPNSDIAMQAGVFAGLLAFARAHDDEVVWFGPVAAWVLGLQVFNRVDALLPMVVCVATVFLTWVATPTGRLRWRFLLPAGAITVLGYGYLSTLMRAYFWRAQVFIENLPTLPVALAIGLGGLGLLAALRWRAAAAPALRRWLPLALMGILLALAMYAFFLREPGGKLTDYNAYALKNFVQIYLGVAMFAAVCIGLAVDGRLDFWRHPAFFLTFAAFSLFLLYKIQIVPEHLWLARRFLPVILPGALLIGCAAAFVRHVRSPGVGWALRAGGAALLGVVGWQYSVAAAPVLSHVEYRGIIPYIETLAERFEPDDLVIIESRDSGSDIHVLGPPLAYIYATSVLELRSPKPDHVLFREFLSTAVERYRRVFFVGTGGTVLLSRQITATPIVSDRVQIDEFETTSDRLPARSARKEFDYGVYQLTLGRTDDGPFTLDVGELDDLHLVRFHAKETSDERSIRWTQDQSEVAITGLTGAERTITLTMGRGGRPSSAPPAVVTVEFNDMPVGEITVTGDGFTDYEFAIPAEAVAAAAQSDGPATLRLLSSVWSPRAELNLPDGRELGVMIDRITVR
jgi:hypothetical protein